MKKVNLGTISVIATPIGNAEDITIRALKTLQEVDIIACEDTRVTSKLCNIHKINCKGKLVSYHEHNSQKMIPIIINKIKNGANIGIVTDAGTPLISDPGYKLIQAALDENIIVRSVPGPSALTAAISISGISSDQFLFLGFLPRKPTLRKYKIHSIAQIEASIIIFESAHRINKLLKDLYLLLGNRKISVLREITKMYEENIRGNISEVIEHCLSKTLKGEIVLIIEKAENKKPEYSDEQIISMIEVKLPKLGISKASKEIAKKTFIKSDYIYKLALSINERKS
ncbi:MAG: 16S rRNA (cytidine(1402)-2'-O)-methyltransferase [Alphaproteobacteria bacterium]|nr:16S rRNA (cytidine(1402)-2'-O)-methyltransferase [Alphaproteobacteria bacterium]